MAKLNEDLLSGLEKRYTPEQIQRIDEYLSSFVGSGQVFAVRIFERASILKKRPEFEALMALFTSRDPVFKANPERIGDPDDTTPGGFAIGNVGAFFSIYADLGLKPKGLY